MTKGLPDLGYPTDPHGRIPAFNNVEEEAEFWDTHDITDFLDESWPVEVTVSQELSAPIPLRLDREDRVALVSRASRLGVEPATLARTWLKERLREEAAAESGYETASATRGPS